MKLKKYSWLAALPMIFTACQEDTLVKEQLQDDKIYTLSATMDGGVAMSRAQIQLGNEDASAGEIFMWNAGDKFALYQKLSDASGNDVLSTSVFEIDNMSQDKKKATFSTENPATANKNYTAIYPANLNMKDGWKVELKLQETLDFSSAESDEEIAKVWQNYMNNNMYMLVKGKIASDGSNELNFDHLCALFRVTYTNNTESSQTIETLSFRSNNTQFFKTSIEYNLFSDKLQGGGATSMYTINYNGGLTVESGQSVDLYAFLLPYEFNVNTEMQLYVKTNSEDKGVSISVSDIKAINPDDSGFVAGKRYWFKVTETAEGLVWSKDYESSQPAIVIENEALSTALYEKYGSAHGFTLNSDGYATILLADANDIKQLDIDSEYKVNSLSGIENFINLEELNCKGNNLANVKLTNSKLRKVNLESNQLTSLDVSGLSSLEILSCAFNGDLKDNLNIEGTSLKEIRFQHTNATELPEGLKPGILEILDCGDNSLTSLDLSDYEKLKQVYFARNQLISAQLQMPEENSIVVLDFSGNSGINTLDLSIYPSLREFWISGCNIEEMNFSSCTDIDFISCENNKLSVLDLVENTKVTYLTCGNQRDQDNNIQDLALTLPKSLLDRWNNEWKSNSSNYYVGVNGNDPEYPKNSESQEGNTSGMDFQFGQVW